MRRYTGGYTKRHWRDMKTYCKKVLVNIYEKVLLDIYEKVLLDIYEKVLVDSC